MQSEIMISYRIFQLFDYATYVSLHTQAKYLRGKNKRIFCILPVDHVHWLRIVGQEDFSACFPKYTTLSYRESLSTNSSHCRNYKRITLNRRRFLHDAHPPFFPLFCSWSKSLSTICEQIIRHNSKTEYINTVIYYYYYYYYYYY